ncbi:zinc finger BED domain-containing protein RICESLEEPER 2 [Beta vulgaris subsp. vulgaris]|uniref:zinc finger BED domain-containing protein RICESLEEPER 2 n=1 Tax=Beta vulgaris subsp. vulgaris TaxID=3555 RepID=UPI0025466B71|nr:zinc finger BED domain-containing protein RICESLEEPER 2 [Beta vulgaris subsp. vulgaris]
MMLETAMKFQRVFSALNLPDEMGVSLNERPPDAHDWKKIERLVVFLEGFYLFTRRISNSLYVTSNKGLYEIMALNDILKKWVQNVDLDFQAMAISMKQKYDKYWGNVEKMNMLIYIAVILDPHSKLIGVQLILMDMYGKEKGEELANAVKNYAYSLFEEYRSMHSSLVPESRQNIELSPMEEDGLGSFVDYMKSLKDRVTMMKGTSGCMISEFDRYLNEQIGEKEESDTLSWWGNNGHRFPIVSRMARDILAIPLSTSFSVGGCQLDPYRSALPPMMVQTLVCAQDWLRPKGEQRVDLEETLPELLELEEEFENNNLEEDVVNVDPLI